MTSIYRDIMFLTSAEFDEDALMEMEDRARLSTIASMIHDGEIGNIQQILFVTEGNLASIETTHHMMDLLFSWKEKVHHIPLGFNFWSRLEIYDILQDFSKREVFDKDLWIFVGSTQYVFRVMAVLFPDKHNIYGSSDGLPSAVPIGVRVRKDNFFHFKRDKSINTH